MQLLLLLTPLVLLSTLTCTTTPETGRSQLNFVPKGQLNEMGEQAYQEILTKEPKAKDPALVAQVREVASRIAQASGADFEWEFNVIDEPKTVNAFCLPGGKIAVYTGILPVAENTAGLAAILGHEVAHATLNHSGERLSQGLLAQFGAQALSVAFRDNQYRNLIAGALGVGLQFGVMLPYSRKHESEADYVGLVYTAKAGYDPAEAPRLWQRMAKQGGSGGPEFLSTHPDPLKRADALQARLPEVQKYYAASQHQGSTKVRF